MLGKKEAELRLFRRNLFSTEPSDTGLASVLPPTVIEQLHEAGKTVPHRFGPVRSVTDRSAVLTVVGDIMDQAVFLKDPAREGVVLTLSVAASNKQFGTRQAVDPAEARAWVEAIAGPLWFPHFYTAGALSSFVPAGTRPGIKPLTTLFFYLFLGTDGVAHAEPEHQLNMTLTPLEPAP